MDAGSIHLCMVSRGSPLSIHVCMEYAAAAKMKRRRRASLTAERWSEAALSAIARRGVARFSVKALAAELGVTRGSFYWHFSSRAALVRSALDLWERRATADVIGQVERNEDPAQRLEALFREVAKDRHAGALYLAIASASRDRVVGEAVGRVTDRRLGFLAECYEALGLTAEDARLRAILAYSAYLGLTHLRRDAPAALAGARSDAYLAHFVATLIPEARSGERGPPPPGGRRPRGRRGAKN